MHPEKVLMTLVVDVMNRKRHMPLIREHENANSEYKRNVYSDECFGPTQVLDQTPFFLYSPLLSLSKIPDPTPDVIWILIPAGENIPLQSMPYTGDIRFGK